MVKKAKAVQFEKYVSFPTDYKFVLAKSNTPST